ncbi:MAG: phosphoribosylaminoimidazolesuccinocarboxamide synthase [Clostridiales bacterium]|jgi:phosphoribosylaminoimidazole-succinocarboxamide synthase|nr:phosphoribosylaminoimidazolesuccinocarboxamide synthase [Clostridiales bacterium]
MQKRQLLYSGKAKDIYATSDPNLVIMRYRDDLTALNGEKRGSFEGKGAINQAVSDTIFAFLENRGIKTHFVKTLGDNETLVKAVTILPLEVIVRNVAAGSFSRKYGVKEGTPLKSAVLEYSYKMDELGDPMLAESHILALGLATQEQLNKIADSTYKVNDALKELFSRLGLNLIDFKVEFGVTSDGDILLADEITQDSCRLWDMETGVRVDKDRFRQDLGGVKDAYQDLLERLTRASTPTSCENA